MSQKTLPYIEVEAGNNYDLGYAIGKKLKNPIRKRLAQSKRFYKSKKLNFTKMMQNARRFTSAIVEEYPQYYEELRGMAAGAGVDFRELFTLNCEEELLYFFIPHCTSIVAHTKNGQIIIGHNEDWSKEYRQNGMVVIKGKLPNFKFLSVGYMGSLPGTSCGLNSFGLAYTLNALDAKKFLKGIPRRFQLRALLEAKSFRDAEKLITMPWRSIVSNTMLAWKKSFFEDIEALWKHFEVFRGQKFIVHTNHPLLRCDQNKKNTDAESKGRYTRACDLLSAQKNNLSVDIIKDVLRDHKTGICGHINRKDPTYHSTISSTIINPSEQWMEVCFANPCKYKYIHYRL